MYGLSSLGQMFKELKVNLATQFIQTMVVHTPRVCNKPAHVLAAIGAGLVAGESNRWFSNDPDDVTRAVTGGLAVSTILMM